MNLSLPKHSSRTRLSPGRYRLTAIPRKYTVHLLSIEGGHHVTQRLAEMGLTPGVSFEVLQNNAGPLLLRVRGSRLAVGRGMAAKIWVEVPAEA